MMAARMLSLPVCKHMAVFLLLLLLLLLQGADLSDVAPPSIEDGEHCHVSGVHLAA
jgi:hypothetical protein